MKKNKQIKYCELKKNVKSFLMEFLTRPENSNKYLSFQEIRNVVKKTYGAAVYNSFDEKSSFTKWITNTVKDMTVNVRDSDRKIAQLWYLGKEKIHATGIKIIDFDSKPEPTNVPQKSKSTQKEIEFINIGRAVDKYIGYLKEQIKKAEFCREKEKIDKNSNIRNLSFKCREQQKQIEKLNTKITKLNERVGSKIKEPKTKNFTLGELATFR